MSHKEKTDEILNLERRRAIGLMVNSFGDRHGLKGVEIAEKIGITQFHYYTLVKGTKVTFSLPQFIRLKELMNEYGENVTLDSLILGVESSRPVVKEAAAGLVNELKRQHDKLEDAYSKLETDYRAEKERFNKCYEQNQKLVDQLTGVKA